MCFVRLIGLGGSWVGLGWCGLNVRLPEILTRAGLAWVGSGLIWPWQRADIRAAVGWVMGWV